MILWTGGIQGIRILRSTRGRSQTCRLLEREFSGKPLTYGRCVPVTPAPKNLDDVGRADDHHWCRSSLISSYACLATTEVVTKTPNCRYRKRAMRRFVSPVLTRTPDSKS